MTIIKRWNLSMTAAACLLTCTFTGTGICEEPKEDIARDAIYGELLGPGILYSINYEHLITPHVSLRGGFSKWSVPSAFLLVDGSVDFTGFPITLNYLAGEGNSRLELGAGLVPILLSVDGQVILFGGSVRGRASVVSGTATIGYRYQPVDGGFVFRIGFTPILLFKRLIPTGGLSMGVAF